MKKLLLYSLSIFLFLAVVFAGIGIFSFLTADDDFEDHRKRGQFHGFEHTVTAANGPGLDSIVIEQSEYEGADQFIFELKEKMKKADSPEKLQALAAGIVIYSNHFFEKDFHGRGLGHEFKLLRDDAMNVYIAKNAEELQLAKNNLNKTINSIHKGYFGR